MGNDDPFGLHEPDRTQLLRPQPGGRGPAPRAASATGRRATAEPLPEGTPGRGPLVRAAYGLLALAPRLRSTAPPGDPAELRQRVEEELRRFEDRAHASGVDGRLIRVAHYALCALIDDVALNTPWGAHGAWKSMSLAGTLHHDVAAGERFFDILDQARREPDRHRPLLELMAACLALGFEGQYRLGPVHGTSLTTVREELAGLLRHLGSPPSDELSPQWRGVEARHVAVTERIPVWVGATATAALLLLLYTGFVLRLGGYGERLGPLVASLPPAGPVEIVRTATATAAPPLPVQPRIVSTVTPEIQACLAPAGIPGDAVYEDLQKVRVRLPNAGMFASGSADLEPALAPVIRCVGDVLGRETGRVLVMGHTDDVPIRTARFPSNWELSTARAEAVERVLVEAVGDPGRIGIRGKADTEPVASNATPEGRAQNRRVEIVVLK
jgi:type VI secretion system protein ImpK